LSVEAGFSTISTNIQGTHELLAALKQVEPACKIYFAAEISTPSRFGHAREYVGAMWLMLQEPYPDDYVIGTGENHSVREFCETAFSKKLTNEPQQRWPSEVVLHASFSPNPLSDLKC